MVPGMNVVIVAAILVLTGLVAEAVGETWEVGDLETLAAVVGEKAGPGDIIAIQPGVYRLDRPSIKVLRSGTPERPVTIRGVLEEGVRPRIDAGEVNVDDGIIFFPEGTHDVIVENLDLCNAAGSGREGEAFGWKSSGVRIYGANITVRNCRSHHNENGFYAGSEADFVLVEDCEIDHSGTSVAGREPYNNNFYFNAKHQMVRNCYIHHATGAENFKSRGGNTIFAFNWVEEEAAYSVEVASGNDNNTLWLGNVVMKRTTVGEGQGRLLGLGDGTWVAAGTLVMVNNTFVTVFPRDYYIFTEESSTGDIVLVNNVFAGEGELFLEKNGKGSVTGSSNWIQKTAENVPDMLKGTIRGDDPGFADGGAEGFRPAGGSPLVGAGVSVEEYSAAVRIVLDRARDGSDTRPSPAYLAALSDIEAAAPAFEPVRKGHGFRARKAAGGIDIGAFGGA